MKVTLEIYAPLPSLPKVISFEILPSFVLILEEIAFLKFYEDIQKKKICIYNFTPSLTKLNSLNVLWTDLI